ncbi:MAG: peptidoglycan-binding protein [Anaerovoracaceae bacterium]
MATRIPFIPQNIIVHLGTPKSSAQNVTVSFADYIKNVASSEIYPTWNKEALEANIYAQISYAVNRVYLEFYRSQGYNFDITNSTSIDQKFINGRNIFSNIEVLVDEIFNIYISRIGNLEPLAAKFCNGTTTTCDGLSQWGSESLAQEGYEAFAILQNYYGQDIELISDALIQNVKQSYPGTSLKLGSTGSNVKIIQVELNRISQNYPLIPKINNVDGVFDAKTEKSVKTFQSTFNLTPDGIVGKATWYKMLNLYVGITKLSELDSEGVKLFDASLEYPDAISLGNSGEKVEILQYFLQIIAEVYLTIPSVDITGYFGPETDISVKAFQQQFNLPQTGVVGEETWDLMYNVFKGIADALFIKEEIFPVSTLPYGGTALTYGSKGRDVMAMQEYINVISLVMTEITPLVPTGIFDAQTQRTVKEYQETVGLPQTGIVDRTVWNSITNSYKDVVFANTSRPIQYPGRILTIGQTDNQGGKKNE